MNPLRVLSLFDGISCAQVALQKLNIPVEVYYASEVEPNAIKVTQKNYPNTIQLGDVSKIDFEQFKGKIDLLIGGSPCQSLSILMVRNRENLSGKSGLFFEFLRALEIVQPKWFLLENVANMKQECCDAISECVGVKPFFINSNCFSAQDRERYYWTNTTYNIMLPPIHPDTLKDILQYDVHEKYYYDLPFDFIGDDKRICAKLNINGHDFIKRVQSPNFKCQALTCISGGYQHKKIYLNGRVRKLTPIEYERLQNLPDNYTEGISDNNRYSACGNGFTVDVIVYLLSFIKEQLKEEQNDF